MKTKREIMKIVKKITGWVMIVCPFIVLFVCAALEEGIWTALFIFLVAAFTYLFLWTGAKLIN